MDDVKISVKRLKGHAANVRLAGQQCTDFIEAIKVTQGDGAMLESKQEMLQREQAKQTCLLAAADFMEQVASLLTDNEEVDN